MSKQAEYLKICEDERASSGKTMVKVIDHETYELPNGERVVTHSRPMEPAPDGRFDSPEFGWHDVLCKWVKLEDIDKPCEAKI